MKDTRILAHRIATLDLYQRLLEMRSAANLQIPSSVATSHKNLEQSQFLLAIVGKVKAGKSTFINALLKQDLLPTDALQATAAIIEVFHSKKPFLRVTYANNTVDVIESDSSEDHLKPLTEKLREVAAIDAAVRDLPVAQLNDFIIECYDPDNRRAEWGNLASPQIGKKSQGKNISKLGLFLQGDLPNIHNLDESRLRQMCIEYLEKNKSGSKIAKKIEVGIPFPEHEKFSQFDNFRIVDTPGIGAKGGFAERTLDFLINADGVIYLHREEPSEKTLHDSLESVIPEKVKKHMLLVLTHKCSRDDVKNDEFIAEARKCCSQIPPERIFLVDSLTDRALQSYYECKTWEKIAESRKRDSPEHKEWKNVTAVAFEDAEGNRADFLERLERQSHMRNLRKEIFRMAERSLGIQIDTLLGSMALLYTELEADAAARANIYQSGLKPKQQIAQEMHRLTGEMAEYRVEAAKRISKIKTQFNLDNPNQELGKKLGKLVADAEEEINGKKFLPEDTAKTANDFLNKIKQDVDDDFADLVKEIQSSLEKHIDEMQVDLQSRFRLTVPKIPLDDIIEKERKRATLTETISQKRKDFFGICLRIATLNLGGNESKEIQRFDAPTYFKLTRQSVLGRLSTNRKSFVESVSAQINRVCDEYNNSVADKIKDQQKLIDEINTEQLENDSVRQRHDAELLQVKEAKEACEECRTIQRDL